MKNNLRWYGGIVFEDLEYSSGKDLYGYKLEEDINKTKYLKVVFESEKMMKSFKYKIKNFYKDNQIDDQHILNWLSLDNSSDCNLYDTDIPPIVKFLHDYNISSCSWISSHQKIIRLRTNIRTLIVTYNLIILELINLKLLIWMILPPLLLLLMI